MASHRANKLKRDWLSECRLLASSFGGLCLSEIYCGSRALMLWKCKQAAHLPWKSSKRNIQQGYWCSECAYTSNAANRIKKYSIDLTALAAKHRGSVSPSQYRGLKFSYQWTCAEGHTWQASASNVIHRGTWCPECSCWKSENKCRETMKQIFLSEFPKCRPTWLINSRGNQMELDGYNVTLGIAFEHHGEQHYTLSTPFIVNNEHLSFRLESDQLKRTLCRDNSVCLIEIPQLTTRTRIKDLPEFILSRHREWLNAT